MVSTQMTEPPSHSAANGDSEGGGGKAAGGCGSVTKPERIQKILSAHGAASRRAAEQMIRDGRVTVNRTVAVLGQRASFPGDIISIDGRPLEPSGEPVYIMLNKPRGYITTVSDERGRKTVMSLVRDIGVRVYPVGRLDKDSSGLLLMTNDGQFSHAVTHPSNDKIKTYDVLVRGDAAAAAGLLRRPTEIDSRTIRAASVRLIERDEAGGVLRIAINEGRNRQIRKMCAKYGLEVQSLKRVSIGPLELGSLETGKWRHLTREERDFF